MLSVGNITEITREHEGKDFEWLMENKRVRQEFLSEYLVNCCLLAVAAKSIEGIDLWTEEGRGVAADKLIGANLLDMPTFHGRQNDDLRRYAMDAIENALLTLSGDDRFTEEDATYQLHKLAGTLMDEKILYRPDTIVVTSPEVLERYYTEDRSLNQYVQIMNGFIETIEDAREQLIQSAGSDYWHSPAAEQDIIAIDSYIRSIYDHRDLKTPWLPPPAILNPENAVNPADRILLEEIWQYRDHPPAMLPDFAVITETNERIHPYGLSIFSAGEKSEGGSWEKYSNRRGQRAEAMKDINRIGLECVNMEILERLVYVMDRADEFLDHYHHSAKQLGVKTFYEGRDFTMSGRMQDTFYVCHEGHVCEVILSEPHQYRVNRDTTHLIYETMRKFRFNPDGHVSLQEIEDMGFARIENIAADYNQHIEMVRKMPGPLEVCIGKEAVKEGLVGEYLPFMTVEDFVPYGKKLYTIAFGKDEALTEGERLILLNFLREGEEHAILPQAVVNRIAEWGNLPEDEREETTILVRGLFKAEIQHNMTERLVELQQLHQAVHVAAIFDAELDWQISYLVMAERNNEALSKKSQRFHGISKHFLHDLEIEIVEKIRATPVNELNHATIAKAEKATNNSPATVLDAVAYMTILKENENIRLDNPGNISDFVGGRRTI